jgi:hypothetical protein
MPALLVSHYIALVLSIRRPNDSLTNLLEEQLLPMARPADPAEGQIDSGFRRQEPLDPGRFCRAGLVGDDDDRNNTSRELSVRIRVEWCRARLL